MMRRLPILLVAAFLAITLARVAQFTATHMRAGVLGWLFAAGLGVAVYTASYWTRTATTRRAAGVALVFFVAVDSYFNFADTWLSADTSTPLIAAGAVLYGLFPTVSVALLGWLSGSIRRLPPDAAQMRNGKIGHALAVRVMRWIGASDAHDDTQPAQTVAHEVTQAPQTRARVCASCGKVFASQQSLAAHMRVHARREVTK